jgi:hypothetical protein
MTRPDPVPADLVVFRTLSGAGVARVDLVREKHVTGFAWRQGDRRWERRNMRIGREHILAVLERDADPAPIADALNVLTNRRASERMQASRRFDARVDQLVAALRKEPA